MADALILDGEGRHVADMPCLVVFGTRPKKLQLFRTNYSFGHLLEELALLSDLSEGGEQKLSFSVELPLQVVYLLLVKSLFLIKLAKGSLRQCPVLI